MSDATSVLEVRELRTVLNRPDGPVAIVDGVSFDLMPGETLGLVGESGSGKSMTALSLMGLTPRPHVLVASGTVRIGGRDLLGLSERELSQVRGAELGMIFQEPTTALNPVLTIGEQLVETLRAHTRISIRAAREAAIHLLQRVRLPDPERHFDEFPHRLSGGMCQRVVIALAIAGNPKVLIADEPTTALDVTVQAQILELIRELSADQGMAVLLITHDLGVVAGYADRVAVMYAGRIVETAPVLDLFHDPRHPYTQRLLSAMPRFTKDPPHRRRFEELPGMVPPLGELPPGCAFAPRCSKAQPVCGTDRPTLAELAPRHCAACWVAQAAGS
jgi:oligopeptide/dipeptide ABC transporter ATP-binding protein